MYVEQRADDRRSVVRSSPLLSITLIAIVGAALSFAYYFAIALPANNRDHLSLERQKYSDEQGRRAVDATAAAAREAERKELLQACLAAAENLRITYLKLNGTITKAGTIRTEDRISKAADDRKRADADSCFKQFVK